MLIFLFLINAKWLVNYRFFEAPKKTEMTKIRVQKLTEKFDCWSFSQGGCIDFMMSLWLFAAVIEDFQCFCVQNVFFFSFFSISLEPNGAEDVAIGLFSCSILSEKSISYGSFLCCIGNSWHYSIVTFVFEVSGYTRCSSLSNKFQSSLLCDVYCLLGPQKEESV